MSIHWAKFLWHEYHCKPVDLLRPGKKRWTLSCLLTTSSFELQNLCRLDWIFIVIPLSPLFKQFLSSPRNIVFIMVLCMCLWCTHTHRWHVSSDHAFGGEPVKTHRDLDEQFPSGPQHHTTSAVSQNCRHGYSNNENSLQFNFVWTYDQWQQTSLFSSMTFSLNPVFRFLKTVMSSQAGTV